MNNITIFGRLGRDSELRTTKNDTQVLSFALGSDIGYGDNKSTNWFDCVIFGDRGAKLADSLVKGTAVVVTGELAARTFEKKDGTQGFKNEIRVSNFTFAGGPKPSSGDRPVAPRQQRREAPKPKDVSFDDDDIPY